MSRGSHLLVQDESLNEQHSKVLDQRGAKVNLMPHLLSGIGLFTVSGAPGCSPTLQHISSGSYLPSRTRVLVVADRAGRVINPPVAGTYAGDEPARPS
jgi:hypothetical protein